MCWLAVFDGGLPLLGTGTVPFFAYLGVARFLSNPRSETSVQLREVHAAQQELESELVGYSRFSPSTL